MIEDMIDCEGVIFLRGSLFNACVMRLWGVMTRFLQMKNEPSRRRKLTPGHFSTSKNDRGTLFDGGYHSSFCRQRWNITTQELKVCDGKMEVILFVVNV